MSHFVYMLQCADGTLYTGWTPNLARRLQAHRAGKGAKMCIRDSFIREADTGTGVKFPKWARLYLKYVLPLMILIIFIMGYVPKIQAWMAM